MMTMMVILEGNWLHRASPSPPVAMESISSLKEQSIAIVGLIRDGEQTLPHLLDQLQSFSCSFRSATFIFYESNSKDQTPLILADWQRQPNVCNDDNHTEISKIVLETLPFDMDGNHALTAFDRVERYAKYRNYLLRELREYSRSNPPDFMMMVDLDIVAFDVMVTLQEMNHALNDRGYSVMCGHGIHGSAAFYYDVFATVLSSGLWTRFSHFQIPVERRHLDHLVAAKRVLEVQSCFNGLAIYKYAVLREAECKYVESESELRSDYPQFVDSYLVPFRQIKGQNAMICEHIPFHFCLSQHNENVKIAVSRDSLVYYNEESLQRRTT